MGVLLQIERKETRTDKANHRIGSDADKLCKSMIEMKVISSNEHGEKVAGVGNASHDHETGKDCRGCTSLPESPFTIGRETHTKPD